MSFHQLWNLADKSRWPSLVEERDGRHFSVKCTSHRGKRGKR